jgi:hypothetical protein
MMNWKPPGGIIAVAVAIGLALQVWYWPQLPEKMATHFDAQGNADDWMDKQSATALSCSLVVLVPLFFIGINLLIRWLPTSLINLPHREFWLSEERREESLGFCGGLDDVVFGSHYDLFCCPEPSVFSSPIEMKSHSMRFGSGG